VGRVGDGSPRSYEAQICNAAGVAVAIVTHDGSREALANVALMMGARTDVPALVARVRELEAALATAERERDLWHAEADVQANAVAAALDAAMQVTA
jgi:uncharacterized ferritin-like protein (DUF455 family)